MLKEVLKTYQGKKVVVAIHGCVLTLMMGNYDSHYDLNFLRHTTKPDIYRMEFNDQALVGVKRVWNEEV